MTNKQVAAICNVIMNGFLLLYGDKTTAQTISKSEKYRDKCKEVLKSLDDDGKRRESDRPTTPEELWALQNGY